MGVLTDGRLVALEKTEKRARPFRQHQTEKEVVEEGQHAMA